MRLPSRWAFADMSADTSTTRCRLRCSHGSDGPATCGAAIEAVVALGGDADTTGAIVGALVGATTGSSGIPPEWLAGMWEWPRSVRWMRRLAERLAADGSSPLPLLWPGLILRNTLFLAVVLLHGLRRLLPPY
jgi:ADP-ribosyl-[dinitrogen reductase] hydrolase